MFFQAGHWAVAFNQDWRWAALRSSTSLLHEHLPWLELYDSPAESSFQSPQLYPRGGGTYYGVDVPSLFSRAVTVAWSGPLLLMLKTHDRRTLCIDLPTSIPIPVGQRITLNVFLRNSGHTVILSLVCTQTGQISQLSGPIKYGSNGALVGKFMV